MRSIKIWLSFKSVQIQLALEDGILVRFWRIRWLPL